MAATAESIERKEKLEGIGCARKRKEDPRFIQGKGTYVDDIQLPGMVTEPWYVVPTRMRE